MQQNSDAARLFPAELLATVGHEFRGPLTTIQGYTATLLRHEQQLSWQERQQFLGAISEASSRLSKLVDRFLQLAQLETHAYTFHPEPVELRALVQESITASQQRRPERLLLLPAPSPEQLETGEMGQQTEGNWTLSGDRRLLRTLLDLLLENALAYSSAHSLIEVAVEPIEVAEALTAGRSRGRAGLHQKVIVATAFPPQERLFLLRVHDHGIGIEQGQLELIFRRFYRVDNSLTRETNGVGLGLALCQEIVARHQGMLWVESAVGEGSTFSIVLPTRRVQTAVPGIPA